MARISDRDDWFDLWFMDKHNMIEIMIRNMQSDLDAGYSPSSKSIVNQKVAIENYKIRFNQELSNFKAMNDKQVNRWCFYDMKKRGAIE